MNAEQQLLCSFDVGLVKMGYCVITDTKIIKELKTVNLKPNTSEKQSLTKYQCGIISNLQALIADITARYKIDVFIIEQQIGKFAAKQIEMCLMQAIMNAGTDYKIDTLSPRCKLTLKYTDFKPKTDTKKYNQNKNQSVANAQAFLEQTDQKFDLDRDMADSLLQSLYYIDKKLV